MKVFIFHASAGHGHQKAAEVIRKAFLDRGFRPDEVLLEDALARTPFFFRTLYPAIYFWAVKHIPAVWGWFYEQLDRPGVYRVSKPFRYFTNQIMGRKLLAHAAEEKPDIVITTHFFPAQLFAEAKRKGKIRSRLITVITDFYPHAFWVNPGTDFYWVMADESRDALYARGVEAEKIRPGGIPVDPRFKPAGRKLELLAKWGLSADRLTLLLTSGSFGLGPVPAILRELAAFKDRVQVFVVAGNNRKLKEALEQAHFEFPIRIFGFVDFMPDLMEAADLLVAKSGGLTTSEALAKGLPMVVLAPIPGQETRNAMLLKHKNAAFFMKRPEQIKPILETILKYPEILESKEETILQLAKPHAADDLVTFAVQGAVP